MSFVTNPKYTSMGHVGGPCRTVEFKLVDIPEMNYTCTDRDDKGILCPRGEVLMRGPCVFHDYYKNEEITNETLIDGWLMTGDVGMILPNGALRIIDRKKNIFKLSQGEYIAPDKIENIYVRARGVAEVFVHGTSLESYVVAIVVPDPDIIQ